MPAVAGIPFFLYVGNCEEPTGARTLDVPGGGWRRQSERIAVRSHEMTNWRLVGYHQPLGMPGSTLTYRQIFTFWLPLARTWLMMASEGPYLAAIIARLGQPTENLAAFGVAFAFAIIIEAPVIMLMAAATALVRDRQSYLALRRFAYRLSAILTVVQLVAVFPPVFGWIADTAGLPANVARLTHQGLAIMLPWPVAIGYRRFRQGLLISQNLTRRVAYGTVLRLATMSVVALVASRMPALHGVHVGTAALAIGVVVEAAASRWMAQEVVSMLLARRPDRAGTPLTQGAIASFYLPLALTSVLAMAIQPMVTVFMGQSRFPLESLAVLPVVHGLTFIFRALGLSYQEVGIALLGDQWQHYRRIRNFACGLAVATATGLGLIAYTPLASIWFERISGLPPELSVFAFVPVQILAFLPAGSVWMSFQRAVLVHARETRSITWASVAEVTVVVAVLAVTIHSLSWVGVVAAATAILLGRVVGNLWLIGPALGVARRHAAAAAPISSS